MPKEFDLNWLSRTRFKNRAKEAANIKRSLEAIHRKYGMELVNYVQSKLYERFAKERKLRDQIEKAENELEGMKAKL